MGFANNRSYKIAVLLGSAKAIPLWEWVNWQSVAAVIDPIVRRARGKPGVRCSQYEGQDSVRFGKIGWNETGHQKWTHGSPMNSEKSQGWLFSYFEIWCPIWTACERDGLPPDFYLSISNEGSSAGFQQELAFNPTVVAAVGQDLRGEVAELVDAAVIEIAKLTEAELAAQMIRPWGFSLDGVGFTNAIQDLGVLGLFKPGPRHDRPVTLDTFQHGWQLLNLKR
jgi:hypothetical protein